MSQQHEYLQVKAFVLRSALSRIMLLSVQMEADNEEEADVVSSVLKFLVRWSHGDQSAQVAIAACGGIDWFLYHADRLEDESCDFVWDDFFGTRDVAQIRHKVHDAHQFWDNPEAQMAHGAWRDRKERRALLIVISMRNANGSLDINRCEVGNLSEMICIAQQYHASCSGIDFSVLGNLLKDAAGCAFGAHTQRLIDFVCRRLPRNLYRQIIQYI